MLPNSCFCGESNECFTLRCTPLTSLGSNEKQQTLYFLPVCRFSLQRTFICSMTNTNTCIAFTMTFDFLLRNVKTCLLSNISPQLNNKIGTVTPYTH